MSEQKTPQLSRIHLEQENQLVEMAILRILPQGFWFSHNVRSISRSTLT